MKARKQVADKEIQDWLDSCPLGVIARVVSEPEYVRHLATTAHIYQPGTLVVLPLECMNAILNDTRLNHFSVSKVQYLIDSMNLPDKCFTFPDGDIWYQSQSV
jgi:hypothetical protein